MQAHAANGMDVLLSFPIVKSNHWIERYIPSFRAVLFDSGAFSELNSGKQVCIREYSDFKYRMQEQIGNVVAWACLDDISGDWKKGIANWRAMPGTFPVFHDTDPPELLSDMLSECARRSCTWIGLGMKPPRRSEHWLRQTLDRIERFDASMHVHCFAMGKFAPTVNTYPGTKSIDSTNWFRDVLKYAESPLTRHLTPAEQLEIIVKRYQRKEHTQKNHSKQEEMFR